MKTEKLTVAELQKIKGGDSGSDLSNTVQVPSTDPVENTAPKSGSDLSNTVQ
jgi:hypothetical protein